MSLWKTCNFQELYAEPSLNGLNRPKRVRGTGFKMVNMGELFLYNRIKNPPMDRVPMNERELKKFRLIPGDLLFARQSLVAAGAGKCSIVLDVPEITTFESHLIRIRLNKKIAVPLFYYYYFISPQGNDSIQSLVMQVAAAGIRGSELAKLRVPVPPLTVQKKIAAVLSTYDDLIENNLRRIKILEEMAQLIFREWFVHFRFPGHEKVKMVDSPLGKIPEGWEVSTISSICTSLQDGDWIETKDQGGNDYRLLQVSNIGVGKFIETGNYRYISNDTFHRLRCKEVVPGDILIARMPKPTGRAWLVTKMPWRMITAVDVAIAKPNYERVLPQYLLHHLNSYENLELIEKHQTGTTRPRISRSTLGSLQMLVPPINLQAYFNDFASLLYQLITCMHKRNTFLKETRDLLLPKLISGELDVSKLDIDTGRLDE